MDIRDEDTVEVSVTEGVVAVVGSDGREHKVHRQNKLHLAANGKVQFVPLKEGEPKALEQLLSVNFKHPETVATKDISSETTVDGTPRPRHRRCRAPRRA